MKKVLIVPVIIIGGILNSFSQTALLTTAERSGFKSTSTCDDVWSFINTLDKSSPYLRLETIGRSAEGRNIPLMIIGNPLPESPVKTASDSRIVIYIQANIHADEVEGKEAAQMFARDILKDPGSSLFKNIIFLICPIFNCDGNEKISPMHRTYQNGPVNGVGVRYNGQSLDLNRDAMKAESPEIRGLITRVLNRWDPALLMDCHTTDGSFHVEPVTFTWMANPNGDTSLISYMKRKMMPSISGILSSKYKTENCFYGEFVDMMNPSLGWIYESADPRYLTNYMGLRNRIGILNENYVYADFRSRVYGCYNLMKSLAEYVAANRSEIKRMVGDADNRTIKKGSDPAERDSLGIEFNMRSAGDVTIKTYEAEFLGSDDGWPRYKKTDRQIDVTVPYLIDFYPVRKAKYPFAYILTVKDPEIIDLLKIHGIVVEKLAQNSEFVAERFEISDLKGAARLNQGHYTNTIKGKFKSETAQFSAGDAVIRMSQPLAPLAAYLLEPESDDGLVKWNFLDRYLVPQWGSGFNQFPVFKVNRKTEIKTTAWPVR